MGLFDAEGQSHNTVYSSSFHAWYLLYDCEPIRGSGFCKIPGTRDCGRKQFAQKETGYYYASLAKRLTKQGLFLMHQSTPAAPSPPPPGYCGAFANFVLPGGPSICQPRGHSRAFDTHAVSYQNITMWRILLGKKADLLIC